jgi:3-dehydroquinate synthase
MEGAGERVSLHTFPAGEAHKSRESWLDLTDDLLAGGLGRDGAVVAVGGGVTGDLAGFVAATFMRGIPVVQVPTSLVAMIDASVGGKTGVDVPGGKNLVGAFHPPRVVVADPAVVETLPREERAQGLAEAVKHGAILDGAYLERLGAEGADLLDARARAVEWAVERSVELKADVVGRDEREGGLRQILNFGHTLGHALEAASGYGVPHGTAVARGMVLEARLGEELGVTAAGTAEHLSEVLGRVGLEPGTPGPVDVEGILGWTRVDKKVRGGRVRYVLLREPGAVARAPDGGWSHAVDDAAVRRILGRGPAS